MASERDVEVMKGRGLYDFVVSEATDFLDEVYERGGDPSEADVRTTVEVAIRTFIDPRRYDTTKEWLLTTWLPTVWAEAYESAELFAEQEPYTD
ncbi:MAG: hypothetical protein WBH73_08715 [Arcanobacterium sp.]